MSVMKYDIDSIVNQMKIVTVAFIAGLTFARIVLRWRPLSKDDDKIW